MITLFWRIFTVKTNQEEISSSFSLFYFIFSIIGREKKVSQDRQAVIMHEVRMYAAVIDTLMGL